MIKLTIIDKNTYLRKSIAEILEPIIGRVEVKYNLYGKPILISEKYFINISHSGDYVAVGLSTVEIGIDLQRCKQKDEVFVEYITGKIDLEVDEYIKIWTIKESFAKWMGSGWGSMEPNDIHIDLNKHIVYRERIKAYFYTLVYKQSYSLTVCCDSRSLVERIAIYEK